MSKIIRKKLEDKSSEDLLSIMDGDDWEVKARALTRKERTTLVALLDSQGLNGIGDMVYGIDHPGGVLSASNWTNTPVTPYVECHKGSIAVVSLPDGTQIYGAGKSHQPDTSGFDFIIGPSETVSFVTVPQGLHISKLFSIVIPLSWPDYGAPALSSVFWNLLLEDIKGKKTLFMCSGGHGRTGTALTILSILLQPGAFTTVDEALAHIRKVYCKKAVESDEQLQYIAKITGLPYMGTEKPHKSYVAPAAAKTTIKTYKDGKWIEEDESYGGLL